MTNLTSFEKDVSNIYKKFQELKQNLINIDLEDSIFLLSIAEQKFENDVFEIISQKK